MWRQRIIYVPALLTLILFSVELTVLGGTRLVTADGSLNPFAPYEAIMPGQPSFALEQYACHYATVGELETAPTLCRIHPGDPNFSQLGVIFQGDKICQIRFTPIGLRTGDLVRRWGHPEVSENNEGFMYLRWREGIVYAVMSPTSGRAGRFSYVLPVYYLVVSEAIQIRSTAPAPWRGQQHESGC